MLQVGSTLEGYAIQASDGSIGTLDNLSFDKRTWKVRRAVADTGKWLSRRKVTSAPSQFVPDFKA